jgi:hypothetical protein
VCVCVCVIHICVCMCVCVCVGATFTVMVTVTECLFWQHQMKGKVKDETQPPFAQHSNAGLPHGTGVCVWKAYVHLCVYVRVYVLTRMRVYTYAESTNDVSYIQLAGVIGDCAYHHTR